MSDVGWLTRGTTVALLTTAGLLVRRWTAPPGWGNWPVAVRPDRRRNRWHVITVHRSRAELMPTGRLPEPLARLGAGVRVHVRTAPGGRGTELAARLRDGEPHGLAGLAAHLSGDDPGLAIRSALRLTRQLAETAEVLGMDAAGMIRGEVSGPGAAVPSGPGAAVPSGPGAAVPSGRTGPVDGSPAGTPETPRTGIAGTPDGARTGRPEGYVPSRPAGPRQGAGQAPGGPPR